MLRHVRKNTNPVLLVHMSSELIANHVIYKMENAYVLGTRPSKYKLRAACPRPHPPTLPPLRSILLVGHVPPAQHLVQKNDRSSNKMFQQRESVFFVLPFSRNVRSLRIPKAFSLTVGKVIPIRLQMSWSTKISTMRRIYKLNWPSLPV